MEAAIVTVGDEILAGEITNTNATWLSDRLADRGVPVRRIVTVPDEREVIADHVRRYGEAFDAVIVTGGVGGTPDDITMDAVAAAFDVPLSVDDAARAGVVETVEEIRERRSNFDIDIDAEASIPAGAEPLVNGAGISPGCVMGNVFVFPGIPSEMKAMFDDVADRFDGELHTRTTYTSRPESNIVDLLQRVRDEFDVTVGCYPDPDGGDKRIKLTAADESRIEPAYELLTERLESDDATP